MAHEIHRTRTEEFRDLYGMDPGMPDPVLQEPGPDVDPYLVDGEYLAEEPTDPAVIADLAAEVDTEDGWGWDR